MPITSNYVALDKSQVFFVQYRDRPIFLSLTIEALQQENMYNGFERVLIIGLVSLIKTRINYMSSIKRLLSI